jgi:hypothetical protein
MLLHYHTHKLTVDFLIYLLSGHRSGSGAAGRRFPFPARGTPDSTLGLGNEQAGPGIRIGPEVGINLNWIHG